MNTLASESLDSISTPLPVSRVAAAYFAEIRCEFLRMLRNPALALPTMFVPLALYSLFAVVISNNAIKQDPNVGVWLFVAFAIMSTSMPALFGASANLALERETNVMSLKRAQPAPPAGWVIARVVVGVVFGVLAYLPMLALALGTGNLNLSAPHLISMSLALLCGSILFCSLGVMVGALVKGQAAPGYANLLYIPGLYLAGLFFPMPDSMKWQMPFWPQFHIQQLAMHGAGITKYQGIPASVAAASIVGFTVMFSAVAIWRLARKG